MAISLAVAFASLLGFALPVVGQQIAGIAHGFDGRPSAGIVVRAVDDHGDDLGAVATAPDGRFELRVARPIRAIVVQAEGVRFEHAIENGGDPALVLTFAGVPHFTLTGRLFDPAGMVMAGVDVACRDAARRTIATSTTDAGGVFRIRANEPVAALVVDPAAIGHAIAGPFTADRAADIDLAREGAHLFCLRGRTLDDAGAPVASLRVVGRNDRTLVAATTSDADGNFVLWSKQPITHLFSHDTIPRTARCGAWATDGTVVLDEREHGYLLVSGRLVDGRGAGSERAAIYAAAVRPKAPHREPPDGITTTSGGFCVRVPRYQTHLWFFQESGNREAWIPITPGRPHVARLGT